jgi:transposase InsO family protein
VEEVGRQGEIEVEIVAGRKARPNAEDTRIQSTPAPTHPTKPARKAWRLRPGKPTGNAHVESFNGTFRQECLNAHWFVTLSEAQEIIEGWRREYNQARPHSSLGYRTPEAYAVMVIALFVFLNLKFASEPRLN